MCEENKKNNTQEWKRKPRRGLFKFLKYSLTVTKSICIITAHHKAGGWKNYLFLPLYYIMLWDVVIQMRFGNKNKIYPFNFFSLGLTRYRNHPKWKPLQFSNTHTDFHLTTKAWHHHFCGLAVAPGFSLINKDIAFLQCTRGISHQTKQLFPSISSFSVFKTPNEC